MGFAFLSMGGSSAPKSTANGSVRNLALGALVLGALFGGCILETSGTQDQTCTGDGQCDDGNPCTEDHCGPSGTCEHATLSDGVLPPALQTPGDCLLTRCTSGVVDYLPDDNDLPDDGDQCTADSCVDGQPHFDTPAANGHGCDVDGGQGMCVDGACVPTVCTPENQATLCPDDNVCSDDFCDTTTGQCVHPPVADGPAPLQTPGDCLLVMCASGTLQTVADNSDLPVDGNDCTDDVCANGTASNPPRALNTPCGGGGTMYCDGSGHCLGCTDAGQCGLVTFCQPWTCDAGACNANNKADGTPADQQVSGDCQQVQCNGGGGVKNVADNGDVPADDGNQCTSESCSSGNPIHPPLAAETACSQNGGVVCNGSVSSPACVQCYDNDQCTVPPNTTCNQGTWTCQCTPTTCGALGLTCGPGPDGCSGWLSCNTGVQDGSETDVDCGGNPLTCLTRCSNGKNCTTGTDCTSTICQANDLKCCNETCTSDCESCATGTCTHYNDNTDPETKCPSGQSCQQSSGTCKKVNGQTCSNGSECISTHCPTGPTGDSVCCASACNGTCRACVASKTGGVDGTCAPIPDGNDPDNECTGAQVCNGNGQCRN